MSLSETEQRFAHAALQVFQRFGVRKATMEEIAAEAAVSKPTLYSTFRNKDAALAGAILLAKGQSLDQVSGQWTKSDKLSEKLQSFLDIQVLAGFDLLNGSPDAAAFETAVGDTSREAIANSRQAEIEAVHELFDSEISLLRDDSSTKELAAFFVDSAMNAKRLASKRSDLHTYLEMLLTLTVDRFQH